VIVYTTVKQMPKSYKLQMIGGSAKTVPQPSVSLPKAWVTSIDAKRGDRIFFEYEEGNPVATVRVEAQ